MSKALDAWTPKPIADHIAAVKHLVELRTPSATEHKRWRDDLPGAQR